MKKAVFILSVLLVMVLSLTACAGNGQNYDFEALKTQFAAVETKIAQLEQERDELHSDISALDEKEDELSEDVSKLDELENQLDAADMDVDELKTELLDISSRLRAAQDTTQANDGELAKIEQDLSVLDTRVYAALGMFAELQANVTALTDRVAAIETMLGNYSSLVSDVEELKAERLSVQNKISGLESSIAALNKEDTVIAGLIEKQTEELNGLKSNLSEISDAISGIEENISALDNKIGLTNGRVTATGKDIAGINKDILGIKDQIGDAEDEINSVKKDIESISSIVNALEQDVAEIKETLLTYTQMQQDVAALLTVKKAMEDEFAGLNEKISGMDGDITALNEEKTKISNLQTNLTLVGKQVDAIDSQMQKINSALNSLGSDFLALDNDVAGLKTLIEGAQKDIVSLTSSLLALGTSIELLDARITVLENKFKEMENADEYAALLAASVLDAYSETVAQMEAAIGELPKELYDVMANSANYYAFYILRSQTKAIADQRCADAIALLKSLTADGEVTARVWKIRQIFAPLNELDYTSANWGTIEAVKSACESVIAKAESLTELPDYNEVNATVAAVSKGWDVYIGETASAGTRYLGIQQALNNAKNGQRIAVTAGTYVLSSPLIIDKNITFVAEGSVIITDAVQTDKILDTLISIKSAAVIKGFVFQMSTRGCPGTSRTNAIIYITAEGSEENKVTVENCVLRGGDQEAPLTGGNNNIQIMSGIITTYNIASYLEIKNNTLENLKHGMYFNFISNSVIEGNTIKDVRYNGIMLAADGGLVATDNVKILNNTLTNIGWQGYSELLYVSGIAVGGSYRGEKITITGNTVEMNTVAGGYGIFDSADVSGMAEKYSLANNKCSVRAGNDFYNLTNQVTFEDMLAAAFSARSTADMTVVLGEGRFEIRQRYLNSDSSKKYILGNVILKGAGADKTEIGNTSVYFGLRFKNGNVTIEGITFGCTSADLGGQDSMLDFDNRTDSTGKYTLNVKDCVFYAGKNGLTIRGGAATVENCDFYALDSTRVAGTAINLIQICFMTSAAITGCSFTGETVVEKPHTAKYSFGVYSVYGGKIASLTGCTFTDLTAGFYAEDLWDNGVVAASDFTKVSKEEMASYLANNTFVNNCMNVGANTAGLKYMFIETAWGLQSILREVSKEVLSSGGENLLADGAVIELKKGTYLINSALVIEKSVILNANDSTIIMTQAAALFARVAYSQNDLRDAYAVIGIKGGVNATINDLTADGGNFLYETGICVVGGSAASLNNVTVQNLCAPLYKGMTSGWGIIIAEDSHVVIKKANISGFNKGGIYCVSGTLDIEDFVITGFGADTQAAQNGIIFFEGTSGSAANGLFRDLAYFNYVKDVSYAAGLVISGADVAFNNLTLKNVDVEIENE